VNVSFEAINDVTRALGQLVESQIKRQVSAAVVTLLPPGDTLPEQTGVNLYLYRVAESPHTRNDSWRGDRTHPPTDRPPLGLRLQYLLTPLGKTSDATAATGDVAHTMLGVAMLTLHEHPILNDTHIVGFDADTVLSSHLRDSYEQIKVTLSSVSVEDLSKIWATINKPYRLSVAYEVSLVELVPAAKPTAGGGIVTSVGLEVTTFDPPQISALRPPGGPLSQLVGGVVTPNTLILDGAKLGGLHQSPLVRVGGQPVEITGSSAAPFTQLTVTLPASLDAGPEADVRVTLNGKTGQPATFVVDPWLSTIAPVRTAIDPAVPVDATLTLTGVGLPAAFDVRYEGPVGTRTVAAAVAADGTITAPVPPDLTNGAYSVRVRLADGNLSNARTLVVLPRVDAAPAVTVHAGKHRISLTGARLHGAEITLIVDAVSYATRANINPAGLTFTFGRLLHTGDHTVAIVVDGVRSRAVTFTVP
jgi:hypothetical protein